MGILGRMFAHGIDNYRPGRNLTRKDVEQIAERAASAFRDDNANVLSCYTIEGEFGLWATIGNYVQTKGVMTREISEATEYGDEIALLEAFRRALGLAFVQLVEKNALRRIRLVDHWPTEAIAEYARLRASVVEPEPEEIPEASAAAPVVVAPVETPVETCVREFREMPSQQWKAKWLNDRRNRPVADRAVAEGRI